MINDTVEKEEVYSIQGQALVNPKFKFAIWIGNNIWFMKITILTLFPKFGFE